ncbi:ABC transporter permease [Cumulibacter manganitolerans]|uniref:ABC transporter permease n=1 Tax=Cumulibacter manganitolerans TaxID=1884992 RepID=UPI001297C721|nr:ABC transporter permease [Cumulibacter manganitolerans]
MTVTTSTPTAQRAPQTRTQRASYLRQVRTLVWRNLTHIKRQPEMLSDVTIQPIMFVLLFAFVFGGSIQTASAAGYREWLLPGIMAQTMAFSSFIVALGLNNDLDKGIIDRFRSLPMSSSSVLVARSMSSLIHSSIGIVVMALTGLIVGWRIRDGLGAAVLGFALLLLFGFGMIWIGILVGSAMRSVEAVNGVMFSTMFPITFLANTFAPTENMPGVLRTIAEWNPISALVQALRELWGNLGGAPTPSSAAWPLQHPVLVSIGWSVLIAAAFAPLALRAYRRRTTD